MDKSNSLIIIFVRVVGSILLFVSLILLITVVFAVSRDMDYSWYQSLGMILLCPLLCWFGVGVIVQDNNEIIEREKENE